MCEQAGPGWPDHRGHDVPSPRDINITTLVQNDLSERVLNQSDREVNCKPNVSEDFFSFEIRIYNKTNCYINKVKGDSRSKTWAVKISACDHLSPVAVCMAWLCVAETVNALTLLIRESTLPIRT